MAGRKREHDRDQIAIDLIEWARKDSSINPNEFSAYYDPPFAVQKLSEWSHEDPLFREAYNICKSFIASRRERLTMSGEMPSHVYSLNASVYDFLIKEEKQSQARFEAELNNQQESKYGEEEIKRHEALMSQVKRLQDSSKEATANSKQ